jgi:hypothetical protein
MIVELAVTSGLGSSLEYMGLGWFWYSYGYGMVMDQDDFGLAL